MFIKIVDAFFFTKYLQNEITLGLDNSAPLRRSINIADDFSAALSDSRLKGESIMNSRQQDFFTNNTNTKSNFYGSSSIMALQGTVAPQNWVQFPATALFLRKSFKINKLNKIKEVLE